LKCKKRKKRKESRKIRGRKERKNHTGFVVVTISKRNVLIETQRIRRAAIVQILLRKTMIMLLQ